MTVSDSAAKRIAVIRDQEGKDDSYGVRVAVSGGGCSGLSYKMEFSNAPEAGDHVVEDKGVRVYIEKKSLLYLVGTELDFSDGLNGKGFFFNNPNASRTCACGESFAV
ncbi:MAG: iron-sulfur cluster assembly accessory protein [Bacteroidia bacterium]|nr:iron-sulfur cluster assembly accessory protein [Bacteroidia bacterium]